jgi:hypothetical protein
MIQLKYSSINKYKMNISVFRILNDACRIWNRQSLEDSSGNSSGSDKRQINQLLK